MFGFKKLLTLWRKPSIRGHEVKGVLVTLPGEEYDVLDCSGQGIVSLLGFVDLSSLRAGDIVEIYLKMALEKPMINRRMVCKGPMPDPIIDFPRREAINPIISLKQTNGVARKIPFAWRWNKL